MLEPLDQGVDLGRRGVQVERRPRGRRDSEPQADRPRAVVADPHRDALLVEHLADVVRVDVASVNEIAAPAVDRLVRADDPQSGTSLQRVRARTR